MEILAYNNVTLQGNIYLKCKWNYEPNGYILWFLNGDGFWPQMGFDPRWILHRWTHKYLETFVGISEGRCYWHLLSRGYETSFNTQGNPQNKELAQNFNNAMVSKILNSRLNPLNKNWWAGRQVKGNYSNHSRE